MSTASIIYGILVFVSIAMTSRMDDAYAKTIMWVQTMLIGVVVFDVADLRMVGTIAFLLSLLLVVSYAIIKKHLPVRDKVLIALSALLILLANLFKIQHWTGLEALHVMALISIVTLLMLMFRGSNEVYNEIGFMFNLAVVSGHGYIDFLVTS